MIQGGEEFFPAREKFCFFGTNIHPCIKGHSPISLLLNYRNKILLSSSYRRVTHEQGKRLAEEMKAVFIETSAKENQVSLH